VLADALADVLRARGRAVARLSIDDFLRPQAERYRRGRDSAQGYYEDSFDYAAVRTAVLEARDAVLLFDGVFLLRPELHDLWDLHIFVSVGFDEVLRRATRRDAALFRSSEEVERRYRARYIPGQQLYLDAERPELAADAVVYNDDPSRPSLRLRPRP
jgi:uridine kinase